MGAATPVMPPPDTSDTCLGWYRSAVCVGRLVSGRGGRHHVAVALRHQVDGELPVVAGVLVDAVSRALTAGERHVCREAPAARVHDAGEHLVRVLRGGEAGFEARPGVCL